MENTSGENTLKLPFLREVIHGILDADVAVKLPNTGNNHKIFFVVLVVRLQGKYWFYDDTNSNNLEEVKNTAILTFCDDKHKKSICCDYSSCAKYFKGNIQINIGVSDHVMCIKLADTSAPICSVILGLSNQADKADNDIKHEDFIISALQSVVFECKLRSQAKQIEKLNGSLLILENKLEESDNTSTLYATLSHEFKTPINSILNSAELLGIKLNRNNETIYLEQYKPLCDIISDNAYRTLRLTSNLLDAAALDAHKLQLGLNYGDIVDTIKNTADSMELTALAYNVKISCHSDFDSIHLMLDKEKIERIILHLISNAIKSIVVACKKDGKIDIGISESGSFVVVTVADNGVGIYEQDTEKIFNKFYTKNKPIGGHSIGTGLGLAIVKDLATLMGGDITVTNNLGGGCTFTLRLFKMLLDTQGINELRSKAASYKSESLNEWIKMETCDLEAFTGLE